MTETPLFIQRFKQEVLGISSIFDELEKYLDDINTELKELGLQKITVQKSRVGCSDSMVCYYNNETLFSAHYNAKSDELTLNGVSIGSVTIYGSKNESLCELEDILIERFLDLKTGLRADLATVRRKKQLTKDNQI